MHPLAYWWRHPVGGHAQIGRHVEPAHFGDVQQLAINDIDWFLWKGTGKEEHEKRNHIEQALCARIVNAKLITHHAPRQLAFPRHPRDATWRRALDNHAPCTSAIRSDPHGRPCRCWSCPRLSWVALHSGAESENEMCALWFDCQRIAEVVNLPTTCR